MADKVEAQLKALEARIAALERKIDTNEKTMRALPDLGAIGKLVPRLDALEKTVANKKDMTPAHETAIKNALKAATEATAQGKALAEKAYVETRFAKLEVLVNQALALAAKR